jgi:glycosyltransferase involved in cell wall biosynthesis
MKIVFFVNDVAYMDYKNQTAIWGWEPDDKRLGGTEESVREWAKELVIRGHEVNIYRNGKSKDARELNYGKGTVNYWPSEMYKEDGADVVINIKSSHIKPKKVPMLYLTNETDANETDLSAYSGIIWPSQWAVDNIPVNNNKVFILPHGYDETKISPHKKTKKQCIYASSPDRGLDLLEQIWPSVVDVHPDAHLYVTYGARVSTPNTTYGEFTEDEMTELFNTSDYWLHPCTGGELFGMTGIKAQAAGCVPVYFPTMALAETVKGGVACSDIREMYEEIVRLMDNQEETNMIRNQLSEIHFDNWKDSTDILEYIIKQVIM